jgi:nicotinamide phosphoribosyltransferase
MEQYPEDTAYVYSYMCARKGETIGLFGLSYYLNRYLNTIVTAEMVEELIEIRDGILNCQTNNSIKNKLFSLVGKNLPLAIKAIPEGKFINTFSPEDNMPNVLVTMTNTIPGYGWLVGFFESLLLKVWYPSTVMTFSKSLKDICQTYANITCDNNSHVDYQVHDFGYRGTSSEESASIGGASHLAIFRGSDNIPAASFIRKHYANNDYPMSKIAQSVPATEHSVMCAYGKDLELKAFERMLDLYPTGLVSIVSDTWNIWNVLENILPKLKDKIMRRRGKVVIRPDSGDPEKVILGSNSDSKYPSETIGCLRSLANTFGYTTNNKGYIELNPTIGLIYGEGFYKDRLFRTLKSMKEDLKMASNQLVVGVGGILLQQHNRDDYAFAFKPTELTTYGGVKKSLEKSPITDKVKKSRSGKFSLIERYGGHGSYFITKSGENNVYDVMQYAYHTSPVRSLDGTVSVSKAVINKEHISVVRQRANE